MKTEIPNKAISKLIERTIADKKWTQQECCTEFNSCFLKEISTGDLKSLNKDFLSRVIRGEFKVLSPRISKLCDFLDISITSDYRVVLENKESRAITLSRQLNDFELYLSQNPTLKHRFSEIFQTLTIVTNLYTQE